VTINSQKIKSPEYIYVTYRLGLAFLLLILFFFQPNHTTVGESHPELFLTTLLIYLAVLLVFLRLPSPLRSAKPQYKTLSLSFDVSILLLLIYYSGSITHSLTALLFVTVATAGILLPNRFALFIAAFATLGLMFNEFYYELSINEPVLLIPTKAALISIALFSVAVSTRALAARLERSERLAAEQDQAIRRLQKLNEQIVTRMMTGIIVFGRDLEIKLVNQAAQDLLQRKLIPNRRAPDIIIGSYIEWRANSSQHPAPIPAEGSRTELEVKFAALEPNTTVAFISDRALILQQAQALKLASLGQLSATIAHEIRNPLSAISHASELLNETASSDSTTPLLNIIHRHVKRIDRIVTDVLSISQGEKPNRTSIELGPYLELLLEHWQEENKDTSRITITAPLEPVYAFFDQQQLGQVINNLVDNALRYSNGPITIRFGYDENNHSWLAIDDMGAPIPTALQHRLFEPFFTSAADGTGLGLFLSRELCQSNQAHLHYQEKQMGNSFVIAFSPPTAKAIYHDYAE